VTVPYRRQLLQHSREWSLVLLFVAMIGLCIAGFNQSPPSTIQATHAAMPPQLGMNLGAVVSYTSQWPFVDAFQIARPWISGREGASFGEGGPLKLTPEGWVASLDPGQYAETVLFENGHGHYPAGEYILRYEGEGDIEFGFESAQILSQQPGKMVLNVIPQDTGIWLKISRTNPQHPIRNLHLILPGLEETDPQPRFHPLFLERLCPFKTLRFMDWMATNGSEIQHWSDRPTPNDATQGADKGVALEYLIELANTLQAHPWFTLPHKATDEYVRQFATMVRDRVDPSLKIYIEYSNEVWHAAPAFSQQQYAQAQGVALGLADDSYLAGLRYYSQRSVEIFKIWESVFGDRERLVRVLAGQYANPWTAEQVLTWQEAYQFADAYAIAPYFSGGWDDPQNLPRLLKSSESEIFQGMVDEIQSYGAFLQDNYQQVREQYGLDLIAYEGGQHLVSAAFGDHEPEMTRLFAALNRHPQMRQLYTQYLHQWQVAGGGLLCHFADVTPYTRYGSWGALEYQNQDLRTAPKYQALLDFIHADVTKTAS